MYLKGPGKCFTIQPVAEWGVDLLYSLHTITYIIHTQITFKDVPIAATFKRNVLFWFLGTFLSVSLTKYCRKSTVIKSPAGIVEERTQMT